MGGLRTIALLVVGIACLGPARLAVAEARHGFGPADETLPAELEALRSKVPDAAALVDRAEERLAAEDHAAALALYNEVSEAAPWWAAAPQRRCEIHLVREDRASALDECRAAWTLRESPSRALSLAIALLSGTVTDRPTAPQLAEADALVGRVLLDDPTNVGAARLRCRIAEHRMSMRNLRSCVQLLHELAPEEPITWYYLWLFHGAKERWARAEAALQRAEELGLDPAIVAQMRAGTAEARPGWAGVAIHMPFLTLLWALSWLLLVLTGLLLSTATRRVAERLAASPLDAPTPLAGALKLAYRWTLLLLCGWYWINAPVLVAAVLAAGVAALSGYLVGGLPAGFSWSILIILLLVVAAMAASVLRTRPPREPGIALSRDEHPHLWALIHEVADAVHTAPIDHIFITPGTDVAVYQERGLAGAMGGREAPRCLVLGYGGLSGLKVGHLRSILAHEYGHFAHGDTVGGDLALGVRRSVHDLVQALVETGFARWFNPMVWAVVGFDYAFRLVSLGASRLQEIQADRAAIRAYGTRWFVGALQEVDRWFTWFDLKLNHLLRESIEKPRPLRELYWETPEGRWAIGATDFERAMAVRHAAEEGESRGSHPSTVDRIRWAEQLAAPGRPGWNDDALCLSLFSDRATLERQLNEEVRRDLSDWIDWMARAG